MRSLRKVALAGATAAAVAFGSTSVAIAQEDPSAAISQEQGSEAGSTGSSDRSLPAALNDIFNLEGDQAANGTVLFGEDHYNEDEVNPGQGGRSNQPAWAQALYVLTALGAIGSILGLVVGPVANFIAFGPFTGFGPFAF